jgi:hypothetical protein
MAFVFLDLNGSVISKVVCSFFIDVGGSFSHRWFGNLRLEGENKMGKLRRLVYTL